MSETESGPNSTGFKRLMKRLEDHVKKEKTGLRDKIFKEGLPSDCGERAEKMFEKLTAHGCNQSEVATDLTVLTLYDVAILIDDSHSMGADPQNIEILKKTLEQICEIYEFANPNGVKSIKFLNHTEGGENVKREHVEKLVNSPSYNGVSRLGTELQRKVLVPFVLGSKAGPVVNMTKPLLVIIITDGVVEGERVGLLTQVILNCVRTLIKDDSKGGHAIAFQFASIGNDPTARKLFDSLDDHKSVWNYVDSLPADYDLGLLGKDGKWNLIKWEILPKLLIGPLMSHWDDHEMLVMDIEEENQDVFEEERPSKDIPEDD